MIIVSLVFIEPQNKKPLPSQYFTPNATNNFMAIKSHLIDRYWLFYVRISRDDFIENELSLLLVIFFVPE